MQRQVIGGWVACTWEACLARRVVDACRVPEPPKPETRGMGEPRRDGAGRFMDGVGCAVCVR